jgi:hypothetical protein
MESFEWHGEWFIPESEKHVGGMLNFSEAEGIRLTLIGTLTSDLQALVTPIDYPLLHGITTDGKWVTLARCLPTNNSFNSAGVPIQHFRAHQCYVGAHFESEDELRFDRATIRFSLLNEWSRTTGISMSPELTFSYKQPDSLIAESSAFRVELRHDALYSFGQHEASIRENPVLVIHAPNLISLQEFNASLFGPIRHLFTLIFGRPSRVDDVVMTTPNLVYEAPQSSRVPIQVIWQPISIASGRPLGQPLIPYSWVHDKWNTIIPQWLDLSKKLEHIINLVFALYDMENTYIELRFLTALQALEGYHREMSANAGVRREPSLRNRLQDLIGRTANIVEGIIDGDRYVALIVPARNALTHRDRATSRRRRTGEELLLLTEQSRLLLETFLLLGIGVSNEEARNWIASGNRAGLIRQLQSQR